MLRNLIILLLCYVPTVALANDKLVQLHAPQALIDTGVFKHILPRFTLKTQVRVELIDDPAAAQMVLGPEGRALFEGAGAIWHMKIQADHPGTKRFADWFTSDVGKRTVLTFAPDGGAPIFQPPSEKEAVVAQVSVGGDLELGKSIAQSQCGRCHRVVDDGRLTGIGSTPSFFVLRTFEDWESRFAGFYALKPHGAFTQIEDVTEPFPEDRPSPIVPVELTLDDVEALLAYVEAIKAADLGAPLDHQ